MVETIFRVLVFLVILSIVLAVIGTVSVGFNLNFTGFGATLSSFLSVVCYILPIKRLLPVVACSIGLISLRIVVALLKSVWSILPVRG